VIHSWTLPDGTQKIEDTGTLTKKRMETIDDGIAARAAEFIEKQAKAGKPMFVWLNFTHMHSRTHTKPESVGQYGRWQSPYHDTMIDHDKVDPGNPFAPLANVAGRRRRGAASASHGNDAALPPAPCPPPRGRVRVGGSAMPVAVFVKRWS
jgi:hypothetical protein